MRSAIFTTLMGVFTFGMATLACAADEDAKIEKPESPKAASALDFAVKRIDGEDVKLEKYRGQVVLIVNVASRCGLTPQYKDLQKLHERYAEKGLAILGFPANDFGKQEPGTNQEIKEFCTSKFGVAFDMFAKVVVTGEKMCPLYKFLTSAKTNPKHSGPIKWNFTKFLLDREGRIAARFEPRTKPSDEAVIAKIEELLKQ